ncbi:MAG TPA: hypothetical protein RMH80_06300, partial [Polyangiaceae bacterium LLY-WYZ-15_(1-7)]|nr:hypothetical protein [Polyangiaceae bacterium LLY-WYZ-15_(1-7)]
RRAFCRAMRAALPFWTLLLLAPLGLGACSDDDGSAEESEPADPRGAAPAPPTPEAPPEPPRDAFPGYPLIDDSQLLRAPERYDHLVPRLVPPTGPRYRNLVYEANNVGMRGPRNDDGFYEATGSTIAERWREAAAGVKKVFALRDALFSQQDHPIDHDPVAVMMPPSWVTVAVAETLAERPLQPVQAPPIDDDDAWAAFSTPQALFGSFPPSERLHETATRARTVLAPERLRVTNARRTVQLLARDAQAMIDAATEGAEAVAAAGAEAISLSDRRYFGERLRREHVILIGVENPNRHELVEEAKGLRVHGRELPQEAVDLARRAIYRRRLRDGDIAVERYDLAVPAERRRAIAVLEELLPAEGGEAGGDVWLWVHGGLDARGIGGRDATPFIGGFREQVEASEVDTARLHYLSKPHVPIGGRNLAMKLDAAARRFRALEIPLSLNIGTRLLQRLIDENEERRQRRSARAAAAEAAED